MYKRCHLKKYLTQVLYFGKIGARGDSVNKFHIDHHYSDEPICYGNTLFIQLGRLYCSPSAKIGKHAHANIYELTIVTGGEGIVTTNDYPVTVKKGDIYLSFPGDFHEITSSETNPLKYDFFAFNTKNECLKQEIKSIVSTVRSYPQRVFRDESVNITVSNAIEILALLFEEILYYTVRNFKTDKPRRQSKYTISADELCYQIMHYIDTHIYTIDNLSVLSEKLSYNYSYLSDIFKKNTGNTIADYYQTRRHDTAALLIEEKRLSVSKIAEMLRYSSPYSFSKAFKNKYGVSPKSYSKEKKT